MGDEREPTMEVEVGELKDAATKDAASEGRRESTLDAVLGELEDELEGEAAASPEPPRPKSSLPPPLPPRTQSRPPTRSMSAPPPPPPRRSAPPPPKPPRSGRPAPLARPASAPPPLRPKIKGLGRAGGPAPSRQHITTAHGMPAPQLEPDSDEQTLVLDNLGSEPLREVAASLVADWEPELAETKDRARRARLAYELARLHEGPLSDAEGALDRARELYARALDDQKDHVPALRGARRVALAQKRWRDALPYFDAEARLTADSKKKASLLYAKGRVLEDVLGDDEKAKQAYKTAAELDRADVAIVTALEQRDRAETAWGELERTLERKANAVAKDARHRAALIVERARVMEHRANRVDAALELYETALRLDPHATSANVALERLCHAQKRWRDLIRVLERRAAQSTHPEERALALYRVGRLHAERLGNRDEALDALERAAKEQPDDPLVLEELASLLERAERWPRLVDVIARLASVTPEAQEQLALWHRIGNLLDERLQRPAQAREAFERALGIDPTHVPTLQALGRIYEQAQAWDALVAMHLAEAEDAKDLKRRAAAHARVAEVIERTGESLDDAMAHHARALSLQPGYAPSFKALTRLYADAGKHRALVELYERAVEQAAEQEPAITYLFKIGSIYEDQLAEHAQAAHAYARILERDEAHLGALHALQRATERAGRYEELARALEREAELRTEDARVVDLLQGAAEIRDERLGDAEGAMTRYRRVLEIDGSYAPALAGLGRIYHRTGRWDDLLELYERELELDPKGASAPALLHKMGSLCEERIGDELRAIDCYKRALDVDARHRPSLTSMSRRLAARRDWPELVRILELELDGLSEPRARARAAYRLGEVHEQHLEAPDRAAAAYETALAAWPGHAPSLEALARLRAMQGAWRRLVDQLEEEAAEAEDPQRAVDRLVRAGELWSRALDDPRRAVGCYERALEIVPAHLEALLAVEQLYRRLARTDALAKTYGALARVLGDPGARVAALRELARIVEKDPARAGEQRTVHEAILQLAPDDPAALEALERLALAKDDRALLAKVDQRLALRAGDAKIASAYQTRLAESLEVAGDPAALDAYRGALTSDPENVAAAKGLSRVAKRRGEPSVVVDAARREANVTPDPQRAARLWVEAARVLRADIGDAKGALGDYERALELWPDDADAAAGVVELLLEAKQAARAADRLARAAASAKRPERVAALWMEVARLQSELSNNVPGAITSLGRVLKESPNHVPALRELAALHGRQGRWAEAAELLAKVIQLAPSREVLERAHLSLAEIWDEKLDDPSRALVSLQAVLSLEENHPEALARLARLSARTGDPDKAMQTLRRLADRSQGADKAAALVELSRLAQQQGDEEAARQSALAALAIGGPGSAGAARHLELAVEASDWQDHAGGLRAWLREAADPLRRRTARVEIARIYREELARPSRAVEELEKAVKEQPTDVDLRVQLAVALRLAGHHEESAAELRLMIGEYPADGRLWRELARTLHAVGDLDAARRALMPLALLGEATAGEQRELSQYKHRPGRAHAGALEASLLEAFYPVARTAGLTELLRRLTPAIGKLYPPDYDAFGVSSRDKLGPRSSEATRALADRIAAIFGVADFHLFLHRARGRGTSVELGEPAAIMMPAGLHDLGEAHAVFALARAMSDIAIGLHAVDKLTPRELEIVLASVSRRVAPGFGQGLTGEDVLDDIGKRLYKALPRKSRKQLDDLARSYVGASAIEFAQYVEAMMTSANRIALLVCDDLAAAVEVLRRNERDLAGLEGAALLRHPIVARLVRFWVSPDAEALRERCGLRVPSGPQPSQPAS